MPVSVWRSVTMRAFAVVQPARFGRPRIHDTEPMLRIAPPPASP